VPEESVTAYKGSSAWSYVAEQIFAIGTEVGE